MIGTAADEIPADDIVEGRPTRPASDVPAGTTTRFILLIAAVVATTSYIYTSIYLSVPAKAEPLAATVAECTRLEKTDPDYTTVFHSIDDVQRFQAVLDRWRQCMLPNYLDEASWSLYGLAGLFGLACLVYLLHPWWIKRRRRSTPLRADDDPGLVDYLDDLCTKIGIASPNWLLAPSPYVRGMAFGLPWRHYLQLNAGLVIKYTTDRSAFRAIVLHELAHLRHRDVGKTYLTMSIWWSFVAAALVPMTVLTIQPRLFYGPRQWHHIGFTEGWFSTLYVLFSLLVLASLVYLTRNAILRIRETDADAFAARDDEARGRLRAAIKELRAHRGPRWLTRWGTHPEPARRLQAVNDPWVLQRTGLWELAGVGVAAAMLGSNFSVLFELLSIRNPVIARVPMGLLVGALMIGLLTVNLWRATMADPTVRPVARTWLGAPAALVAGFLVGSWLSLDGAMTRFNGGIGTFVVATLLVFVGVMLVTGWVLSATRGILRSASARRGVMSAVVITAIVAAESWFAVWFTFREVGGAWTPALGDPPDPGGTIGWYHDLAIWTGLQLAPALDYILDSPLTLPGLTLLWLVPIVATTWRRARDDSPPQPPVRVDMAVIAGACGGLFVVLGGIALPFVSKAALPLAVRRLPDSESSLHTSHFGFVYDNAYVAMAVLAQAIVAAIVAARAHRQRPALVMLAVSLTAALATIGKFWVSDPISLCNGLYGAQASQCFTSIDPGYVAHIMHWIAIKGAVVMLPTALLGAAAGAWCRSTRSRSNPQQDLLPPETTATPCSPRPRKVKALLLAITLGLLVTADATATAISLPRNYEVWTGWPDTP